jgi:DNA-binding CsgD family transcriptional regulator/tetratricopeptide (TPR) repeat protein
LVGRRDELDTLLAAFERARNGDPALVVVEGEAGIGKTRLIGELVTHAELDGARALLGSCLPFAEAVPYAPLARILEPLRTDDTTPGPPPGAAEPHDRARFFHWVTDRLAALAREQPVLVVVEDLHWADESTGDLLLYAVGALRDVPMLVVVSRRPAEHEPARGLANALAELIRSGRAERLALSPLDDDDVTTLIAEILGVAPARRLRDRIVGRADGNPFFAEELVAAGGGSDLPAALGDVILERVNRVGDDTRRLLQVAAVVGRRVGHALLREIAAIDAPAMDSALRDAVSHQLLVAAQQHYSFRHALGHEAVYQDLLPGERIELHERVAVALTRHPELALGADPAVSAAELAHHWHAAGRIPETLAAAVTAGRAAEAAHAPVEADRHFSMALELWPRVPDAGARAGADRAWLLEHAADTASLAGDHGRAARLVDELLAELDRDAGADPLRYTRAQDRRALYLWYQGDVATSRQLTEQLLASPDGSPSPATVTRLAGIAYQLALQLQYVDALGVAQRALDEARCLGKASELGVALHVLGSLEGHLGRHDDALERLRHALDLAVEHGDTQRVGATWHNLIEAQLFAGQAAVAVATASAALPELDRLGLTRTYAALTTGQLTYGLIAIGRWDDADAASGAALADDVDPYFTLPVRFARLHLLVRRGRYAGAERVLDELAATFAANPYNTGVCAVWRAEMQIWQRDWAAARSAVERGYEITAASDEVQLELRLAGLAARLEADRLWWARRNGTPTDPASRRRAAARVDAAGAFLDRIDDAIACCSLPFRCQLALARAELTRLDERPPAEPWSRLAGGAGTDSYLAAYANWRLAEALLTSADRRGRGAAESALRAASAGAAGLGADPLLAEIADLARRARIEIGDPPARPEPAGDEGQPPLAPGDLERLGFTMREVEVLRLLAKGLSNREIGEALYISAKTASVHVTHIFQKLNVTTRVQAAVAAQRLDG